VTGHVARMQACPSIGLKAYVSIRRCLISIQYSVRVLCVFCKRRHAAPLFLCFLSFLSSYPPFSSFYFEWFFFFVCLFILLPETFRRVSESKIKLGLRDVRRTNGLYQVSSKSVGSCLRPTSTGILKTGKSQVKAR
jgi:hypothetical protein